MGYCDESDLYLYGLPRGALASPGRLVESVDASEDTIELDSHGFASGDAVQFRAAGGGGLPSPIDPATTYYALRLSDWRFRVSLTAGGSAIDITSAGTTFLVLAPLPKGGAIEKASRMIDDMLPAHVVPLSDPIPDIIRITTAELAAAELLALSGGKADSLSAVYDAARKRVDRWARGVPVRGDNAPTTAQRSISSASRTQPPWRRYGGIA